jgi:heme-degrading monooxygenase HmoA
MKRLVIVAILLVGLAAHADSKAAVARMWRGRVPASRANEYEKYLSDEGIQGLRRIKDNLGVQLFRRELGDTTEFVVISYWPDRDAIRAYAGDDIEKVHNLPRDHEFLIDQEKTVKHYDIKREELGPAPPPQKVWKNADPAVDCAQANEKQICAQLLAMRDRDQQARYALLNAGVSPDQGKLKDLDSANLAELDAIVGKIGWPKRSEVGVKAAGAAWTIVQHNDHATKLRYLEMMSKAVAADELDLTLYATFVDRVRIEEDKPQVYGTQYHEVNGEMVPYAIEDEANVEKRRAQVGMMPLAEYAKLLRETYRRK